MSPLDSRRRASVYARLRSATDRAAKMASMYPYQQMSNVAWMREAELKHARLAMLAAVGWPLAELANPWLSSTSGRAPSLFNGGIGDGVIPFFLVLSFMGAAVLENKYEERVDSQRSLGKPLVAGDFGFDPLGADSPSMRAAEITNGRVAMVAITAFALEEALTKAPIFPLNLFLGN